MVQLPEPLLQDLSAVAGFDRPSFLSAHNESALTSVRMHPFKGVNTVFEGAKIPWCEDGIYLNERPVFTLDPAYHGGAYYVQEASSMFLTYLWKQVIPEKKGLRVLDLCGAPGGKSTLLASLLDSEDLLISNEVIRSRASILEENVSRWGYTNNWVSCNDPRDFGKLEGYFDAIVIDAPCSGSGLFRKDARALTNWTEANVALCSGRQQRIIADVWPALKQDGVLVYATCSYSTAEDEAILDWMAGEFGATSLKVQTDESWGIVESRSPKHAMTGYRFFPGKTKGEGFFIAAILKNDTAGNIRYPRIGPASNSKIKEQAAKFLIDADWQVVRTNSENYSAVYAAHEVDWLFLQKALYFRKAGLSIGAPAGKEWIPAHDIALSIDAAADLPCLNGTREQALKFLKREDLNLPETEKGWKVIKFNNIGLGWIKSLGNRSNNYLPKHWRIRMEIPDDDIA